MLKIWKGTTDRIIIRRRKFSICVSDNQSKNTDAHLQCLIPAAFPTRQWLRQRASFDYTYIACFVVLYDKTLR